MDDEKEAPELSQFLQTNIRFEQYLGHFKHIHKYTAVYETEAVGAPLAFLDLENTEGEQW